MTQHDTAAMRRETRARRQRLNRTSLSLTMRQGCTGHHATSRDNCTAAIPHMTGQHHLTNRIAAAIQY